MSDLPAYNMPPSRCPICQTQLDHAMPVAGVVASPEPGDATVCAKCGAMLKYGEGLGLEVLSDEELEKCEPSMKKVLLEAHQFFKNKARFRGSDL